MTIKSRIIRMQEKQNIFALTKQDTAVLKGIVIIAMLMHHLWGCPPVGVEPYTGVLGFLGNVGKVCVAMFLFCSVYGLSNDNNRALSKNSNSINRIMRLVQLLLLRFVKFYSNYLVEFSSI